MKFNAIKNGSSIQIAKLMMENVGKILTTIKTLSQEDCYGESHMIITKHKAISQLVLDR